MVPKPMAPKPVAPKVVAPKMVAPKMMAPKMVAPKPVAPKGRRALVAVGRQAAQMLAPPELLAVAGRVVRLAGR